MTEFFIDLNLMEISPKIELNLGVWIKNKTVRDAELTTYYFFSCIEKINSIKPVDA